MHDCFSGLDSPACPRQGRIWTIITVAFVAAAAALSLPLFTYYGWPAVLSAAAWSATGALTVCAGIVAGHQFRVWFFLTREQRLRRLLFHAGRPRWDVQFAGRTVAALGSPDHEGMDWGSWRLTVLSRDPELAFELRTKAFWNPGANGLTFRERHSGQYAEYAGPGWFHRGVVAMHGLWGRPGFRRSPWEWAVLFLRRRRGRAGSQKP